MGEIGAFLAHHPYFEELNERELLSIARLATPRHLARDEILGLEGDVPSAVYLLIQGNIRALKLSVQGREQVVNLLGPGHVFYLVPALDGAPLPVTTQAAEESDLLSFSLTDFVQVLRDHPSVGLRVLSELARRLRHMSALVEDLALRTVPQRLARLLVQKARSPETETAARRITQREMAAQLGTVREVVSRTLREFEAQGWIRVHRGVIEIIDPDELDAVSQSSG
ncbi:MAG: Crp/Fnr family transcriptional regulator [Anaerolineae bacterium]|nr:Crp/Fnr family transcriptional regulator [Anaerolineae bacterium]